METELYELASSYVHHNVQYKSSGFVRKRDMISGVARFAIYAGFEFVQTDEITDEIGSVLEEIFGGASRYKYDNDVIGWPGYEIDDIPAIKKRNMDDVMNVYVKGRVNGGDKIYSKEYIYKDYQKWYRHVMSVKALKWKDDDKISTLMGKLEQYKCDDGYSIVIKKDFYEEQIGIDDNFVTIKDKPAKYDKQRKMWKKEIYAKLSDDELCSITPSYSVSWILDSNDKFGKLHDGPTTGSFGLFSESLLTINLLKDSDEKKFMTSLKNSISYKDLWALGDKTDMILRKYYKNDHYNKIKNHDKLLDEFVENIDIVATALSSKGHKIQAQGLIEYRCVRIKYDLLIGDCVYDVKETALTKQHMFEQVLYLVLGRKQGLDINKVGFICPSTKHITEYDLSGWINNGGCDKFLEIIDKKIDQIISH